MTFYSVIQRSVSVPQASQSNDFMNFGILFFLAAIMVAVAIWRLIKKKRESSIDEQNGSAPAREAKRPSIYFIQATDVPRYADKLQIILKTMKSENRIKEFSMLDADDDLSSLTHNIDEQDLILIVLTNQLEPQKKEIENIVKPMRARVAEIIVDNVVYDNAFLTFPTDLRPICDRDDKDAVWGNIAQSLKDMFPAQKKETSDRRQPINERLLKVKNHPEYPELLKIKPGTASLYGRYGCGIIFGFIFAVAALFMSFVVPEAMADFGPVGFVRILLLFFSVVGAGVIIWGSFKLIKLSSSKLRRLPALIVDKRISVTGGGQNSSATTWYYITLEFSDGERQEFEAGGKLYGKITKDDTGVAYIKDRYLVDYRRLPV